MATSKFEAAGIPVVYYTIQPNENLAIACEKLTGGTVYLEALRDGNNLPDLMPPAGTEIAVPQGWLTQYWADVYSGAITNSMNPWGDTSAPTAGTPNAFSLSNIFGANTGGTPQVTTTSTTTTSSPFGFLSSISPQVLAVGGFAIVALLLLTSKKKTR